MRLPDLSIRRPVFAVMLIGGLVVLGAVSVPRLGVDLWPRVEFPLVSVTTVLQGAAPSTMEREVTEILEEAINPIEGIRSMRSASSDSLSLLWVEFELEYDIQEKAQQVRDKVNAARAELPLDVEPPVIDRLDPDASPILAVMLSGHHAIRHLSETADKQIKPILERVQGVGSVTLVGAQPREIRVWIDPLRLAGYGLAVDEVLAALRREHVELPGGRIETERFEYALKTEGKLRRPEEFASLVIADRGGRVVHLRDVATVEDGVAEERTLSRLDGRRGVSLLVRRQSGENTVRVVDRVRAELDRIRADLPEGYEMIVALDTSQFIRSAIRDVAIALAWGAVLASLVVLLFLRNPRSTAIAAITIPSSLVASFIFFYLFGFTINTMTLTALALSIGLLIDDAIVVLENGYRHMERGKPPARAASEGTDEIGLAVVATTLSVCAVFVPIAFLYGVVGRFFREFGLVAVFAMTTSTLIALSLTPMLCARYVRVRPQTGAVSRRLEAAYQGLERSYRRLLTWGLAHRATVIALAGVAFVAGIGLARTVPVNFVTPEDRSEFNIWLKMPLGSTVAQTRSAAARVEQEIGALPEVRHLFTTIGAGSKQRINEALVYVQLVHKSRRRASQAQLMVDMRRRIAALDLPLEDVAGEEIGMRNPTGSRHAVLMFGGPVRLRPLPVLEVLHDLRVLLALLVLRAPDNRREGLHDLAIDTHDGDPYMVGQPRRCERLRRHAPSFSTGTDPQCLQVMLGGQRSPSGFPSMMIPKAAPCCSRRTKAEG